MTTQLQPQDPTVLPPRAHENTGWYGGDSSDVAHFLHALRRIPASTWLEITADAPIAASAAGVPGVAFDEVLEEQADYAARRRLHAVLEAMPAVVRRITGRIDTDLAAFHGFLPEPAIQRMRRTAHLAAFALAAQSQLDQDDLVRLYRPFAALIPPQATLQAD